MCCNIFKKRKFHIIGIVILVNLLVSTAQGASFWEINKTYEGANYEVYLSFEDQYLYNGSSVILEIDFDDGNGFKDIINLPNDAAGGKSMIVHYDSVGSKTWSIRAIPITFEGSVTTTLYKFDVKRLDTPDPDIVWRNYTADEAYAGGYGSGEVYIYTAYGNASLPLKKPIIMVDGFDHGNFKKAPELYNEINQEVNLIEELRQKGHDIIILNPDDGSDYIQRSAFILEKLIKEVNAKKERGHVNVIIGPSMGGLIARYALADMERDGIDHETKLYISFDAPNRGANVPLGLQYFIRYYSDKSVAANSLLAAINSSAARSMMLYHLSHQAPDSLADDLFLELKNMGLPKLSRNVAFTNGSVTGTPQSTIDANGLTQELGAGNLLINGVFRKKKLFCKAKSEFWIYSALPGAKLFIAKDQGCDYTSKDDDIYTNWNVIGYDQVSGGKRGFLQELKDTMQPPGYLNGVEHSIWVSYSSAVFIPTFSALDIDPSVTGEAAVIASSPFDKIYFPSNGENENHVQITQEKKEQIISEIQRIDLSWLPSMIQFILE